MVQIKILPFSGLVLVQIVWLVPNFMYRRHSLDFYNSSFRHGHIQAVNRHSGTAASATASLFSGVDSLKEFLQTVQLPEVSCIYNIACFVDIG